MSKIRDAVDDSENVMSTRELRGDLSEAIMRTAFGKERIVVTHHGKRYAALVPIADLEALEKKEEKKNVRTRK